MRAHTHEPGASKRRDTVAIKPCDFVPAPAGPKGASKNPLVMRGDEVAKGNFGHAWGVRLVDGTVTSLGKAPSSPPPSPHLHHPPFLPRDQLSL